MDSDAVPDDVQERFGLLHEGRETVKQQNSISICFIIFSNEFLLQLTCFIRTRALS